MLELLLTRAAVLESLGKMEARADNDAAERLMASLVKRGRRTQES